MKKLNVLILKSYAGPLIMTFFIALFILLMQFLWKWIDEFVGKGLEWYVFAELLFYASSTFVPLALPLAILLSSLMTFGNLGEHYELVAMKSSGISLRKIMKPLIIISVILSVFAFYFSNNVLPVANLKFKSLLYDIRKKKLAVNIKEGIFYDGLEDYVIKIGSKDADGKTIYDVMIYNHTKRRGNIDITVADSGTIEPTPDGRYLIFTLYRGYNYQDKVDRRDYRHIKPFQRTNFKEQTKVFDLASFEMSRTDEDIFKNYYEMLDIGQLNQSIDSLGEALVLRKINLANNYLRNYSFYRLLDSNFIATDSIYINQDILSNFNKEEKLKIIESSLNSGRNLMKTIGHYKAEYKQKEEYIRKHKVVWHKKFTLSFACLVLFFIGAPMGAIIRRGGLGLPVVVSVLFFVMYHIISMIGEKSAKEGAMDIENGMWLSSAILLPMGIYLTYKATTDAPLMDREIWNKFFLKFNILKLIKKINPKSYSGN